jgi:hypothetical protein
MGELEGGKRREEQGQDKKDIGQVRAGRVTDSGNTGATGRKSQQRVAGDGRTQIFFW